MSAVSDSALIESARSGDGRAFEVLLSRYRSKLSGYLAHHTRNREDAEDLAQETVFRAFRGLPDFSISGTSSSSFPNWLFTIARNLLIDRARSAPRVAITSLDLPLSPDSEECREVPDLRYEPRRDVERAELRAVVREAIDSLTPVHRDALVLRDIQGYSYGEIAAALGVPEGTVKSRIFKARSEVGRRVQPYMEAAQ